MVTLLKLLMNWLQGEFLDADIALNNIDTTMFISRM